VGKISAKLRKRYPDARTALDFSTPLEMLVPRSCRPRRPMRVNRLTPALFKKYKTAPTTRAPTGGTGGDDSRVGVFRQKAKNLMGWQDARGEVRRARAQTMAELMQLPGVARKTANV